MSARYRFERFTLDLREGCLYDGATAVHLQPKAYELLVLLVEHPGQLFAREDLLHLLWPDVHVTDESLSQVVSRLRRALRGSKAVETVPRRGYRFVGSLAGDALDEGGAAPPPARRAPPAAAALPGRDGEIARALELLDTRAPVVLHGGPGSGKTTLARAVLAALGAEAIEIDLCSAEDAEALNADLAAALGVRLQSASGPEATSAVASALSARPDLVVHLDGPAPTVWPAMGDLIRQTPQLRWVLSCQVLPELPGQRVLPVSGLPRSDSVALLAAAADPSTDLEVLDRVAAALDDMPLALQLAAPRLRLMTAEELLGHLDDRFRVLRGTDRSLEAAVDASWGLLDDTDRDAATCLATADVPIPLDGALALLAPLDPFPLDVLQRLTDACWVRVERTSGSRVVVPPHLRSWARARGTEAAADAALHRLATWLVADMEEPAAAARAVADRRAWSRVTAVAPLARSLASDARVAPALRAGCALVGMLPVFLEGARESSLTMLLGVLEHRDALPPDLVVRLRSGVANLRRLLGRGHEDLDDAHQTLACAQATGDPDLERRAWQELASDLVVTGQHAEAEGATHRALELGRSSDRPQVLAHALQVAALTYRYAPEELDHLRQILALPLDPRSWVRLRALLNLAVALHDAGRLEEAEARYRERLAIPDAVDPAWFRMVAVANLGNLLAQTRRFGEAEALFLEAVALAERHGPPGEAMEYRLRQVAADINAGRVRSAQERLRGVLAHDAELPPKIQVHARTLLGAAALRAGNPSAAAASLDDAIARATALSQPRLAEDALALAAGARALVGSTDAAMRDLSRLDELSRTRMPPFMVGLRGWAHAVVATTRGESAAEVLDALTAPGPPDGFWPRGSPPLADRLPELGWLLPMVAGAGADPGDG